MTSKIEILREDAAELYRLAQLTERRRIKDILSVEAKKIETEITFLQEKEASIQPNSTQSVTARRTYDVKITTYAWDQNNSSVKLFITLPNVQTLPEGNIVCNYTDTSLELQVKELEGKNHNLSIKNLFAKIVPATSSWKAKTGTLQITLSKSAPGHWASLTKTEKKEPKVPDMSQANDDPSGQLMNLVKQMYDDGDDEMKRSIAKAWTESREKNKAPEF